MQLPEKYKEKFDVLREIRPFVAGSYKGIT
jgi:hypothetical protein